MTKAPKTLIVLQAKLVKNLGTKNLGIVGDEEHIDTGGYHIGAKSLRHNGMSNDYSLYYKADREINHDWACAIDIGGTPKLLMKLGNRLAKALRNNDPRVHGKIRAANLPYGGVTIDRRIEEGSPATEADDQVQSSSDRGHIHIEIYRSLVLEQSVMDGLYAVLAGVPYKKPSPKPSTKKVVTVKRGDTLDGIARSHKTTWQKLKKLNRLKNANTIYVGQKLRVK